MPSKPARACRCGGRIKAGVCDRCGPRKRPRDTRQSAHRRGYDRRWQEFREVYLRENPLCEDCKAQGIVTVPAVEVHHIQKLSDRPDLKCEPTNVIGLCKRHHLVRTARGE